MPHLPPGLLRQNEDPDVLLMVGTAGHVDHGKTRLVHLLTGCDTDRLKVEKERGMSIELGFAPCSIGRNLAVGIVDVPGHEQFIRNMVAGAAGMDLAMLLVAADDGVMPQTIEHLEIMQFVGVQKGLVVISKIDLATPERIEEVRRQIVELTLGTFLEGAPVCPVSAETLEGFHDFYKTLVSLASEARIARQHGVFRMPVERVFSSPGHGTVVTGMPAAGIVKVGDEVMIQPSGRTARIRGIQRFLREAGQGQAGQCLALNLSGVPKESVVRGDVVARPGYANPGSYVQLRISASLYLDPPLKHGEEVRFHTGTVEAFGKIALYDHNVMTARQSGFGAVHLREPIAASPTDRFVLRRNSPPQTVAGGVILRILEHKPRLPKPDLALELTDRWAMFNSDEERFEYQFIAAGTAGLSIREASIETLLELDEARNLAASLAEDCKLVACAGGEHFLHASKMDALQEGVTEYLTRFHNDRPTAFGPLQSEIVEELKLPAPVIQLALERLNKQGAVECRENRVALRAGRKAWDPERQRLLERIEILYRESGFASPRPEELAEKMQTTAAITGELFKYLCQQGTLVRLDEKVALHKDWMREAERLVVDEIRRAGSLDSGDFKNLIHSSRKYALAILDYFDSIQMTLRIGNSRKLHPAYLHKHAERTAAVPMEK